MINMILLLLFFFINMLLFLIEGGIVLFIVCLFEFGILLYLKLNLKKCVLFMVKNMMFILVIFLCNLLYSDISSSFLVSLKLFLALTLTYIISNLLTMNDFSEGFYYLLFPLKIFGINIRHLSLIIMIAFSLIPILQDEAKSIKKALQSKGFGFTFKNVITRPHIYLIAYLNGLFDRIDELEKSLLIKGFQD